MQYLVAGSCPKLLEGHAFYACACYGPAVPEQEKPAIQVTCVHLVSYAKDDSGVDGVVCSHGGGAPAETGGVQFGIPTVYHSPRYPNETDDGSTPD